ncbi:toprim domain-containing protein [Vibrio cholerae]|nr:MULTISPECIES: toprim domain-containing protein [Vibrio]ANS55706.1 hypothetical protein [Vibrio parahaemolyticus]EJL6460777.1 toprim domain-containing protein [Vibrio cholerae]EJL6490380.1 toprim domain-containing protein [Vibrio cholerae]EJL6642070.1 toprim domain-containing protein [Vibrio cholerae]MBJ6954270.1 toprim domain-containing protein [Vibrio cholerae]
MYAQGQSKIEKVRAIADGKWDIVFGAFPQLSTAIKKAPQQVPCPVSPNAKKSSTQFRFFKDWVQTGGAYHNKDGAMPDGIEVVSWIEGCSKSEAMDTIVSILGGDISSVSDEQIRWKQQQMQQAREQYCDEEEKLKRMNRVRGVAQTSIPAAQAPELHAYLRSRGLKGDFSKLPNTIRYHNRLRYPTSFREEGDNRNPWYSAMLGTFRDKDGKNCSLHRTFLSNGKKAPENKTKLLMSPPWDIRGGYIAMDDPIVYEAEDGLDLAIIGYCEGMETALAIREATGIPMRPHYSSSLLKLASGIVVQGVPKHRTLITLWGDNDRSGDGQSTVHELGERLREEGYLVEVFVPDYEIPEGKSSVDWLDVYVEEGAVGFPIELSESVGINAF